MTIREVSDQGLHLYQVYTSQAGLDRILNLLQGTLVLFKSSLNRVILLLSQKEPRTPKCLLHFS